MKKNYKTESKLSLILCVLGFLNVVLLNYLGLMIGFFLSIIGLYIAESKVRKYTEKNELANIAVYFAGATFIFIGLIGLMFSYFMMLR
jgi:hypothetical protein